VLSPGIHLKRRK